MADTARCCICGEPVIPPYHVIGSRIYCERHFAAINHARPSFWRAGVVQIVGMALFAGVLYGLAQFLGPIDRTTRILIGLFLAVVPTALWMWYFYRQDHLEPEPKTRIGTVFIIALLLTDFLGLRLVYGWFGVRQWAAVDTITSLLSTVLIQGFTFMAIMYIAVRVGVYTTEEFDERMDGIIYGTVAGLGVATLLNLRYIIDNEGVAIGPGVINTVTTALAHASFGGLMGWFMAEAKFAHKPVWWVPLGVALAALLDGLFIWTIGEVSSVGLTVEPWRSLALGLVVALTAFGVLILLMRRSTSVTFRPPGRRVA